MSLGYETSRPTLSDPLPVLKVAQSPETVPPAGEPSIQKHGTVGDIPHLNYTRQFLINLPVKGCLCVEARTLLAAWLLPANQTAQYPIWQHLWGLPEKEGASVRLEVCGNAR